MSMLIVSKRDGENKKKETSTLRHIAAFFHSSRDLIEADPMEIGEMYQKTVSLCCALRCIVEFYVISRSNMSHVCMSTNMI